MVLDVGLVFVCVCVCMFDLLVCCSVFVVVFVLHFVFKENQFQEKVIGSVTGLSNYFFFLFREKSTISVHTKPTIISSEMTKISTTQLFS